MIPGDGAIDFCPYVRALHKSGYAGFVSAELGFQYTHEPNGAVVKTHRALSGLFRM